MMAVRKLLRFRTAAGVCGLYVACNWAAPAQSALPNAQIGDANTAHSVTGSPPVPRAKSPVESFRELLAMTPAEFRQYLTNRPADFQKQIAAKVREYKTMPANERELRLKRTELRWFLLPLMQTEASKRPELIAGIPDDTRELVENRLAAWDQLPPAVQKELLENEAAILHFSETKGRTEEERQRIVSSITPQRREALEKGIRQWHNQPDHQKARVLARFEQFFSLNPAEQSATLKTLSDTERQQIERTLNSFGKLSPQQRAECLHALTRFAEMSTEDKHQFLRNAERWRLMPPDKRQAWRDLVARLGTLPPPPPGLPVKGPPQPPGAAGHKPVFGGN